jgi:oligopeptidase B
MRLSSATALVVLSAFNAAACGTPAAGERDSATRRPPVADKHHKIITVHGESRVDDYFWLREKTNPRVMTYLHAEDDYTTA